MWYHEALSTCNIWNNISKKTRSSVTGNMDDGIPLSPSDSAMISDKKNCHATFNIQKKRSKYLKAKDDALFKDGSKRPAFVLKTLKAMLALVVHRISFQ